MRASSFSLLFVSVATSILFSCKKKEKSETISFDYNYPEVTFSAGDSATFGSTTQGFTYVVIQKMNNRSFKQTLSDKNISSTDISAFTIKSCTIKMSSPADSSFNTFDSLFVKVGGSAVINGTPIVSGSSELIIAQKYPVLKNNSKEITMEVTAESAKTQLAVDDDVIFRVKLVTNKNLIALPHYSMSVTMSVSVTGTTH